MTVRFLHTADNHLRAVQYGRADRGRDFTRALDRVLDLSTKHKVDAILNSGDILDTTRPTAYTIQDLNRLNLRLIEMRLPMFVISGNHDLSTPHWSQVLDAGYDDRGLICVDNRSFTFKGVQINALPYSHNDQFLEAERAMPDADILMWHGMIREFVGYPTEKALSVADLPTRYRWIALGDVHVHEQVEHGPCTVSYPGSTELIRENEQPDKYVDLIEWDTEKRDMKMTALPLETRQTGFFRITDEEQVAEVMTKLEALAPKDPLVFVSYDPVIPNVFSRLCSVLDPTRAILRTSALKRKTVTGENQEPVAEALPPSHFLGQWVSEGSKLYGLGVNLLEPDCDAVTVLDEYCERALGGGLQ
jgi:DNA repair exonuclease SbcCD nuclease subunit